MLCAFSLMAQATDTFTAVDLPNLPDWANNLLKMSTVIMGILSQLIVVAEFIVRLTPSEKDNGILRIIQSWLDKIGELIFIFKNRKKDGGVFTAYRNKDDAPRIGAVVKLEEK